MKEYVCGFYFSEDLTQVALIHKLRPDWQRGRLNGIGGHVRLGEPHQAAMLREFAEETGCTVESWACFCDHSWDTGAHVTFWVAAGDVLAVGTETDEEVSIIQVSDVEALPTISNVPWLIAMALEYLKNGITYIVTGAMPQGNQQ